MNLDKAQTRRRLAILSLLAVMILIPSVGYCSVFYSGRDIAVERDELVNDDIYILQNDAEIMGQVIGDASVLGETFLLSGKIDGNLNVLGSQLDIDGTVSRSVRALGQDINITGTIDGNILGVAEKLSIRRTAKIGKDVHCVGARLSFYGECEGDVSLEGGVVIVAGTINGNLTVTGDDIQITEKAQINGNLSYKSEEEALIEDGAVILGEVNWDIPEEENIDIKFPSEASVVFRIIFFLFIVLTGFVLILLFKRHTRETSRQILKTPGMSFAVGILTMSVLFLGSIIFMVMIIGIPVAMMMICLGMILFYVGKVYVSIALGRLVFMIFGKDTGPIGVEFLIGIVILTLLFSITLLGWIIYIITFIVGTGAAVLGYLALNKKARLLPGRDSTASASAQSS